MKLPVMVLCTSLPGRLTERACASRYRLASGLRDWHGGSTAAARDTLAGIVWSPCRDCPEGKERSRAGH